MRLLTQLLCNIVVGENCVRCNWCRRIGEMRLCVCALRLLPGRWVSEDVCVEMAAGKVGKMECVCCNCCWESGKVRMCALLSGKWGKVTMCAWQLLQEKWGM